MKKTTIVTYFSDAELDGSELDKRLLDKVKE